MSEDTQGEILAYLGSISVAPGGSAQLNISAGAAHIKI
jgi:hypothetical protein